MTVTAAGLGIIPAAASSAAAACGDVGAPICAAGRERTPGEAAAMGEGVDVIFRRLLLLLLLLPPKKANRAQDVTDGTSGRVEIRPLLLTRGLLRDRKAVIAAFAGRIVLLEEGQRVGRGVEE